MQESPRQREPNAVYEGDTIFLNIEDGGIVYSDGFVDERLTCVRTNASNFEGAWFRILPKLSYVTHKTLSRAVIDDSDKYALLVQQDKVEAEANAMIISRDASERQTILYGQTIQLQHVISGKFLTSRSKALAEKDKSCMKVELQADGSPKSWFTFLPRYRTRIMGQTMLYRDEVYLTRAKDHNLFLHFSHVPREINIHHKETSLKVIQYAEQPPRTTCRYLHTGRYYRLYHLEGQAFVTMSANSHRQSRPYLRRIMPGSAYTDVENYTLKSVFALERLNPMEGGQVTDFTQQYRFRHIATGRYLTIDMTNNYNESCHTQLCGTPKPDEKHSNFILTTSGSDTKAVNTIESQVRDVRLRLHNPNKPKKNTTNKPKASGYLVASSELNDQDMFYIVDVSPADVFDAHVVASGTLHLQRYRNLLQEVLDRNERINHESMKEPLKALELLTSFLLIQSSKVNHGDKMAAPSQHRQNRAREMKLIDVLYEMLRVPLANQLDLLHLSTDPRRRVIHHIHKLINNVLEHIVQDNVANKHYIATRSASLYYNQSTETPPYLAESMASIGSETGSKRVCYSVFENHPALLELRVDLALVRNCIRLIETKGVRMVGMLHFLSVFCSCNGQTLPANQELVARALFSLTDAFPTTRHNILVEVAESSSQHREIPKSLISMAMAVPRGMKQEGTDWKPFGHAMITKGNMASLAVSWKSCRDWTSGSPALYYTPEELNLLCDAATKTPEDLAAYRQRLCPSVVVDEITSSTLHFEMPRPLAETSSEIAPRQNSSVASRRFSGLEVTIKEDIELSEVTDIPAQVEDKHQENQGQSTSQDGPKWVLLEYITWTLEPETLYTLLFEATKTWQEAQAEMQADPSKQQTFDRLHELAQYIHAELRLIIELVRGTSPTTTKIIMTQFSYTVLVGAISNERLPYVIRSALGEILYHTYVAQFPHEPVDVSGRIYVYEDIEATKKDSTLPMGAFELKPNHPVLALEHVVGNDFLKFPHPNKMAVLQATIYYILSKVPSTKSIEANKFVSTLLHIVHDLILFGFYSDVDEQKRLVHLLLSLLDGRKVGQEDVRYRQNPLNNSITAYKAQICRILIQINAMWREAEVYRVMSFFKHTYSQAKRTNILKKESTRVVEVVAVLNDSKLDLLQISKGTLDFICVDLMMYDDKNLVSDAMTLMIRCNTRREHVLKALMRCLLVHSSPPRAIVGGEKASPGFQVYRELTELLPMLKHYVALAQSPASTQEVMKYTIVLDALSRMVDELVLCCCDHTSKGLAVKVGGRKASFWGVMEPHMTTRHLFPNLEKQRVVLHMQVHTVVLPLLKLAPDESCKNELRKLKSACCDFLIHLVQNHKAGQHAIFPFLHLLWPLFNEVEKMGDVLIALLTNNGDLCKQLPEEAVWKMVELLDRHCRYLDDPVAATASFNVICQIIDFAIVYIAPNDLPSPQNQSLWLDILTHSQFTNTILDFAQCIGPEMDTLSDELMDTPGYVKLKDVVQSPDKAFVLKYFQKVLVMLGLVCRGRNVSCEVKCQQTYPLNLVLTILLDAKMPIGLKYVCCRFLSQVFLHADGYVELASLSSPMWRFLMQISNTIHDFATTSRRQNTNSVHFQELYTDYVFLGLLDVTTCFFSNVFRSSPTNVHIDEQVTAVRKAIATSLQVLSDNAMMDPTQAQAYNQCCIAMSLEKKTLIHQAILPRHVQKPKTIVQPSLFDQFKLEISIDDTIQSILVREFHSLILRWENIDRESRNHSENVTLRLFCQKIVEFIESNPTAECVVDALKILHRLVAKKFLTEDAKKGMALVEIEEAMDNYKNTQTFLASCGAARMVLQLIAGNYCLETIRYAIELGSELLSGGNVAVQTMFFNSLVDMPANDQFFHQIDTLLHDEIQSAKQIRRLVKSKSEFRAENQRRASEVSMSRPLEEPLLHAATSSISADVIVHFLTLLAKGHYRSMQLLLLDQKTISGGRNYSSVNVLHTVVTYMSIVVKDELNLGSVRVEDGQTLEKCWELLAVYMQGPCEANQDFLINTSMIELFRKTLKVQLDTTAFAIGAVPSDVVLKQMKSNAVKAMVSVLEGRSGDTDQVHVRLRTGLDVSAIKQRLVEIFVQFQNEKDDHLEDLTWDERFLEEGIGLVTMAKIVFGSEPGSPFAPQVGVHSVKRSDFMTDDAFEAALTAHARDVECAKVLKFFDDMLYAVEIWWNGNRLEKVYFVMPSHCGMFGSLSQRRTRLLNDLDYSSSERLRQFIKASVVFDQEMQHMEVLSRFRLYNFIRPYIPFFKSASFLLAILINLIVLISMDQMEPIHGDPPPSGLPQGYSRGPLVQNLDRLLTWLEVMGYLQTFFSFCVLLFILVISIPLVFRRRRNAMIKQAMLEYKRDRARPPGLVFALKDEVEGRLNRWRNWLYEFYVAYLPLAKLSCLVVLLQYTFFQATPSIPLWLPVALLGFPLLSRTRKFLERSSSWAAFVFTVVYDVFVDRYTAFYFVYLGMSVCASLLHPMFYVFHLLDIVVMSPTLQNVVRSVTKPIGVLALTTLLGVCVMYFFAMLVFFFLPADATDENLNVRYCSRLLDCFILVASRGLPQQGGIGHVFTLDLHHPPSFYSRTQYWSRLVLDTAFYAFAVIMLNMIFGLTIDTFNTLRTATNERQELKKNHCFICGLSRTTYDNHYTQLGIPNGFEKHIAQEHNMWHYLYFLVHVNSKTLIDCTGPEAYVKTLLLRDDLSWFPQGMAKCLAKTKSTTLRDDIDMIKLQLKSLQTQSISATQKLLRKRSKQSQAPTTA
ncbi:hypothetical protein LEN26_008614 [Aphanomyces euteiches]|nr:hypothetical protein LEN26_008614 [Aphanomyces euteiches]